MKVSDYLYNNDKNYRALVDDSKRESWNKPIKPYSALSKIELRRFPSGQWYLKFQESGMPTETGGHLKWSVNSNSSEVKYLSDLLQTDFLLERVTLKSTRNCAIEDQIPDVLWQVVWIDNFYHNDQDKIILEPKAVFLIYNNQWVWQATARLAGKYHQYKVFGDPEKLEIVINTFRNG